MVVDDEVKSLREENVQLKLENESLRLQVEKANYDWVYPGTFRSTYHMELR